MLTIALIWISGAAVNRAMQGNFAGGDLIWMACGTVVLQAAMAGFQRVAGYHAAEKRKYALRQALYRKQLVLGPDDVKASAIGAKVNQWVEGVETLDLYYGLYLPQAILGFSAPFLLLGFLVFEDWVTALALLIAAPVPPLLLGAAGSRFKKVSKQYWGAMNALSAEFLDSVHGLVTLKLLGQGKTRSDWLRTHAEALRRQAMGLLAVNQSVIFLMDWGFALSAIGVAAIVGTLRWQAGAMSAGGILIAILLSAEMIRQINLVAAFFFAGAGGRTVLKNLRAFLDEEPRVQEASDAWMPDLSSFVPSVKFDHVRFRYKETEDAVLDGLSFSVAPGESVGIIGQSGTGKSTLAYLLLRFADPEEGEIRISGHSLREVPLTWLRSKIAMVAQDTHFFHGTIVDNLRMARPDANAAELKSAAVAANLHDWIDSLPDKYDTKIGERAVRLSGGQAQRLAIARAFLSDAPILILDEATANLDRKNEAEIGDALSRLREGRTTLVIAHRAGALRGVNRVIALRAGRANTVVWEEASKCLVS